MNSQIKHDGLVKSVEKLRRDMTEIQTTKAEENRRALAVVTAAAGVSSFIGRTGAVVAVAADYAAHYLGISDAAASVTNGVYTTGSYANPAWLASLDIGKLTVGATLPSNVLASSLTSVGSLAGLTVGSGVLTLPNGTAAACAVNFGTAGTGLFGDATRVFVSVAGTYAAYFTATAFILGTVTNIQNSSGKQHVAFTNVGATSANYFTMSQSATGNPLQVNFTGDTNGSIYLGYKGTGGIRIGVSGSAANATARLHLPAGTAAASSAPLKFTSGTSLTTAEAGAVEFTTDDFFATITTGAARKGVILNDGANLTSGKIPIATTNGRLVDGETPLAGTKVYYVSDTSGGAVTRKLTFTNGILTAET
jgi:hypothetical protein